jgi:hypothetical protein
MYERSSLFAKSVSDEEKSCLTNIATRCESPKRMHKKKLGSLRKEQLKCFGKYSLANK